MPDPSVRDVWMQKLQRYEGGLLGLIREISEHLPHVGRDERRVALAKVELMAAEIEDLIRLEPGVAANRMTEIHRAADEVMVLRAQMERHKRQLAREEEDLDLEAQRQKIRQLRSELEEEDPFGGFGA